MEELSKIAMAHYQASSDDIQRLARDFLCAMDNDGDGKIDQKEFLEFMWDEGCLQMKNPSFFKQLDLDGNGTLDFVEVMTLYYIVKSGRPFCDHFPVLDKPHSGNNQTWNQSFAMVQAPYRPPPVPAHNHHQWSSYPPTGNPYGPTTPTIHNHTWIQNNYSYHYPPSLPVQLPATSTAVQQWKVAFGALNAALTIGSLAGGSSLCSIL
ncbi:serine/threonine-protein phosphatase [Tanacetum coccineum]